MQNTEINANAYQVPDTTDGFVLMGFATNHYNGLYRSLRTGDEFAMSVRALDDAVTAMVEVSGMERALILDNVEGLAAAARKIMDDKGL